MTLYFLTLKSFWIWKTYWNFASYV